MSAHIKIVSIGAAIQDIFLQGKIFAAHREDGNYVQEFELGSKNEIETITYDTGGGATNASVTFARQGLHSMYMGVVGDDIAGKAVLNALHRDGVDTSLVQYSSKAGTGTSVILLSPKGERTVLTYRGASKTYNISESSFHDVRADWFYISSLSGDFEALKTITKYAVTHDIKIAINPGRGELTDKKVFMELLPNFTLLSLNKEEMAGLFGGSSATELVQAASRHVPLALLTDGPSGSYVCDGKNIYKAGVYREVPVLDRIGAGDAFSSGFVTMIAKGQNIERALTFASANSTSVVGSLGAKTGILPESTRLHSMPIGVTKLS